MAKISLKQLQQLIREAVNEQLEEMGEGGVEEGVDEWIGGGPGFGGRIASYFKGSGQKLSREVPKFDLSKKKGPDLRAALQFLLDDYAAAAAEKDEATKKEIADQIVKFTQQNQMQMESLRRQLKLLKNR